MNGDENPNRADVAAFCWFVYLFISIHFTAGTNGNGIERDGVREKQRKN